MGKKTRLKLTGRGWALAFLLSLPIAIAIFLNPSSNWGSMEEGEFAYHDSNIPWSGILDHVFLPEDPKIFLFGFMRPIPYRLFFKVLSGVFHLSAYQYHAFCWVASWLACLAFAWGIVALARIALPIPRNTLWKVALLTWWTPSYLLITNMIYPDCWMQPAFTAIFWALAYLPTEELPKKLRSEKVRLVLAVFFAFLGCQSHEFGSFLLLWTSAYLLAVRLIQGPGRTRPLAMPSETAWISLPAVLGILYIAVYRGFDPSKHNRPDLVISTAIPDMLGIFKYYLLMGTYGVNTAFFSWLGLSPQLIGAQPAAHIGAFVFASAGLVLAVLVASKHPKDRREKLLSWLFVGAALACTLPFLPMQNRSLIYYGLRLNMFMAAFVAIRLSWRHKDGQKTPFWQNDKLIAATYAVGLLFASWTLFNEWNWVKQWGGTSKQIYANVMRIPGIEQCTQEHPCCLKFPSRGWIYNEWTVNWNDGAPFPARFLEEGAACEKTVALSQ